MATTAGTRVEAGVHLVALDRADVAVLGAAAAVLGHALGIAPDSELAEALASGARDAAPACGPAPSTVALMVGLARAHGLLDLADTDDTAALRGAPGRRRRC